MIFLIYLVGAVITFALLAYCSYTEIDVKDRDHEDRREAAAMGGFFGVLWPIALPVAGSVMLFNYVFDKVDERDVKENAQELELMKLGILSKFSKDIEKLKFDKNLVTNDQERYVFEDKVKSEFRRFERDYVRETPYGSDLRRALEYELYDLKNELIY